MALQVITGGGFWTDALSIENFGGIGASTYALDAASEKAVVILQCPKAGTLDRFDFNIGTVTNSPENGLRASFQGVSLTDGQNDGTILGATSNAFVTYAHTVGAGWKSTNFGETVTVTRGQLIACVLDWAGAFTAGDSVTLSHTAPGGPLFGLPYGIAVTGTKNTTALPLIALHYTDGYAFLGPTLPGVNLFTSVGVYHVDSATADEWGLAFAVPFPFRLNRVRVTITVTAGATFELLVYDGDGTTVLDTVTHDGDVTAQAGTGVYDFVCSADVVGAANTVYRVTIRPTTTNTVNLQYVGFASVDLMDTMEGGRNFYMTSRLDQGGAWTDYNAGTFRRPRMALHLTAFDDAVSAGGGGSIFGGLVVR